MLMRLWVSLCSWLKPMRSDAEVAGNILTAQLTKLRRIWPFQLALGANSASYTTLNKYSWRQILC